MTFISVVIATYNRKDMLKKCIEAFRQQTYPEDRYEIVVIDDGSTDGTNKLLEEISKEMANLRFFSQKQGGQAKARNLGIPEAKGPLILFTGDDCIPDKKLLEEHNRIHQKERNVAVLGFIDWHPDLEVTPFMEFIARTHQFTFSIAERERHNVNFSLFYTSNVSVAKDSLLKVGLFDEDFTGYGYEDSELGYRLYKHGLRIIYNRRALTYHYHPVTLEKFIHRQIQSGKAAVIFQQKHPEITCPLRMEDAVSPEIIENFYDSVLQYYYSVGLQIGLKKLRGEGLDEAKFIVSFDELLERWRAKVSDRLLRRLKHENENAKKLLEQVNNERQAWEKDAGKKDETIARLDVKNKYLEQELKSYRDFSEKVKCTFQYRFYKSLKSLLGKSGP